MRLLLKPCLVALLAFGATTFGTAQTLVEKADKQYELHAYRLASQSYESLLQRGTDEWGATSRLADCYVHLNEPDKAAGHYARMVSEGKAKDDDFLQFGRTLMMLGRYDEAATQFTIFQKNNLVVGTHFLKACKFAAENDNNAPDFKVEPLAKVNTAAADFGATILKDQLIWSSSRADMVRAKNNNGARSELLGGASNQLFAAPIEGISTTPFKVRFLKNDFKNVFNESQPSFSADGKMVAFMRNNFAEGERFMSAAGLEMSVYTASVDEDGNWNDIKAFPFNNGATGFPALSADGLTLYIAAIRAGGQGGFDLYSSLKRGNTWGEPRNLGGTINTVGDEITPFADGKTLYFASNWHVGFGGFDVFKTEGIAGEIVNMGIGVNSSNDDIGFVLAPSVSTGFLTSNRSGGNGKYDIYRLASTAEHVNIVILDESKRPVTNAQVTVTAGNASSLSAMKGGNYMVNFLDKKALTIQIKKEGFKTITQKIEPQLNGSQRVMEIELERNVPTQMSTVPTPEYSGLVIDGATGEPLEGVLVRLTNQATEAQLEKTTDARGRFRFPMKADDQLLLTFSSEKFVVAQKMVKASETKTKFIGEIALKPSAVTDKFALPEEKKAADKAVNAPAVVPTGYGIQAMPKQKKEDPSVLEPKTDDLGVKTKGEPVFAVQVAVSTSKDVLNLTKFNNLKKIGNVYVVPEEGKQKIRLGVFRTRADADSAVKGAIALGYEGVFVTQEKNATAVAANKLLPKPIMPKVSPKSVPEQYNVVVEPKKVEAPAVIDSIKPKVAPVKPKVVEVKPKVEEVKPKVEEVKPKVEDKAFKVKIAAMKKPELFDDSKVATLWKVEQIKEGAWTLFVMDGFKTLEQAKTMKKKVQASGFKDAKVVLRDGEKLRVVD